jgi:hemerythrin
MQIIEWKDDYSVGVKELDEQHKKILQIVNRISELIESNNFEKSEVEKILQELSDYAEEHFTNEEIYFREFDYDKTASHLEAHNDYRKRLAEFKAKYGAGLTKETLLDLADFVDGWWVFHINNTDKEYTECFHQHGLY